jgi:hypothetical protein
MTGIDDNGGAIRITAYSTAVLRGDDLVSAEIEVVGSLR